MSIIINQNKCNNCKECVNKCKFDAIHITDNFITINDNCVNCNACVRACKTGALSIATKTNTAHNLDKYQGILVVLQVDNDSIMTVSLQLINKAKQLANTLHEKVYAILLGYPNLASSLIEYSIDTVYNYTNPIFNNYNSEQYISAFYNAIQNIKPSIVLIGATNEGRQIASHLANKCATGLTADCTNLKIIDGNLVQVRPAYGGKIMAEIVTENTRPQFATVKNGVFEMPKKIANSNTIIKQIDTSFYSENFKSICLNNTTKSNDITKANIILCLGNGVKKKEDILLFEKVAEKLGAVIGGSRALVEKGYINPQNQIGLSGNGISPRLLITFGVSGSIQFLAGIIGCKNIIAVNKDENATILKVANYSIVADMYDIAHKILDD